MRLTYAPWGATIAEQAEAARAAEQAGFDTVWVSELQRSAFVPAAALVQATATAGVGTAIALAFVRSPLTIALTAMDLQELSGGRFVLGLGSGVQRLNENWHNARFGRPAAHLRETVSIVRRVMAGEVVSFAGAEERIEMRGFVPREPCPVPVYIAAVGDVMTRLAGEIGDGWIGHELGSPRYLAERILPNLRRGGPAQVVASACCVIDDDPGQARRWAAGLVAFYASVRTYLPFFAWHGFEAEALAVQERFRAGDEQGMIEACPDAMVDALTLAGTADGVRAALGAYEGVADAVKLSPPTHLVPAEVTRALQRRILEDLQS